MKLQENQSLGGKLKKFKTMDQKQQTHKFREWNQSKSMVNWMGLKVWWLIMVKLKKLETKEQFENGAQIIGVESKFPGVRLQKLKV